MSMYPSGSRGLSAKQVFTGSNPVIDSNGNSDQMFLYEKCFHTRTMEMHLVQ